MTAHREALSELERLAVDRASAWRSWVAKQSQDGEDFAVEEKAMLDHQSDLDLLIAAARERDALRAALRSIGGQADTAAYNLHQAGISIETAEVARVFEDIARAALSPQSETSPDNKEGE